MNVYRFEGVKINGQPVKTGNLDYIFVSVAEGETYSEALEFHAMSSLGIESVVSGEYTNTVYVGRAE